MSDTGVMTRSEFQATLRAVLADHARDAANRIQLTLARIPPKALALEFEIFTSQDGEGMFSVRMGLEGPDAYLLNKAIDESADIFKVKMLEEGYVPPVPMVDPDAVEFDVNDTIVDTVAVWLQSVWSTVNSSALRIPVRIDGHDDYGTVTPLQLRAGRPTDE